jgi:hypothetical protein
MGNCMKKKVPTGELTNQSDKNPPTTNEKKKHDFKNIIRIPDRSDVSSVKKIAIKHYPTPQPNILLKSPQIAISF